MRKILFLVPLLILLLSGAANAETVIHTDDPIDYTDALNAAYRDTATRGFSVSSETAADKANAARTLLVYHKGELDDKTALFDICDNDDIHTLIYADSDAADAAFEHYTENGIAACHDEILSVDSLSWGYSYIGTSLFTSGLRSQYGNVLNMPSVKVAIVDTGVDYNHTYLSDRVDTSLGYDFYNNDYNPMDDNNHGTHVCGIIVDNTLSNVTILPIKVASSSGYMTTTTVKSGIQYAVNNGADIINLSIGSSQEDIYRSAKSTFETLFNRAHNRGITICAAAGNANKGVKNNSDYIFPAYMDNTIVVANCTQDGSISNSSNYGSVVDLSAPGTGIKSTIRNNGTEKMSGTSMATPFVTAAAALLKTKNPSITPDEIESEVRSNAMPYPAEFEDYYYGIYGSGILDLSNYYLENDSTATPRPTSTPRPTPTPTPSPTPTPGIQQLITNVAYSDENFIYAEIKNLYEILNNDAIAIAVGYKNGLPQKINSMSVRTEDEYTPFRAYIKDADSYEYITIFVWNRFEGGKPLSKSCTVNIIKTGSGKYEVQTIKE